MKIIVFVLSLIISGFCLAAQTGSGKILTLQNAYGGWIFSIDHSNNNPESCSKSTLILNSSHTQYKEVYSLLLTAYTTGKTIIVFTNGCDSNGYNIVSMVYTSWGT